MVMVIWWACTCLQTGTLNKHMKFGSENVESNNKASKCHGKGLKFNEAPHPHSIFIYLFIARLRVQKRRHNKTNTQSIHTPQFWQMDQFRAGLLSSTSLGLRIMYAGFMAILIFMVKDQNSEPGHAQIPSRSLLKYAKLVKMSTLNQNGRLSVGLSCG